jgi:hypothetical protein
MDDPLQNPEAMTATIARICESEKRTLVAEVLRNCTVRIEQTGYDNWNGGTDIYGIYLQVSPERYAKISSDLKSIENVISTHARALIRHNPSDWIGEVIIAPEVSAASRVRERAYRISATDLLKEIESQRSLMIAVATGGQGSSMLTASTKSAAPIFANASMSVNSKSPIPLMTCGPGTASGVAAISLPINRAANSYRSCMRRC